MTSALTLIIAPPAVFAFASEMFADRASIVTVPCAASVELSSASAFVVAFASARTLPVPIENSSETSSVSIDARVTWSLRNRGAERS